MVDTTWVSPPPGEQAVDLGAMPPSQVRRSKGERLRCSFCQAELGKDKLMTSDSGNNRPRMSSSRFCSPRCRDCVLALAALNPSPLVSNAFTRSSCRLPWPRAADSQHRRRPTDGHASIEAPSVDAEGAM